MKHRWLWKWKKNEATHCVKSVRIRSFSGLYFPTFGLNAGRYSVSLRIQSECEKIRTRKTLNTDTLQVVTMFWTDKKIRDYSNIQKQTIIIFKCWPPFFSSVHCHKIFAAKTITGSLLKWWQDINCHNYRVINRI